MKAVFVLLFFITLLLAWVHVPLVAGSKTSLGQKPTRRKEEKPFGFPRIFSIKYA